MNLNATIRANAAALADRLDALDCPYRAGKLRRAAQPRTLAAVARDAADGLPLGYSDEDKAVAATLAVDLIALADAVSA